jgi:hypothetical protein
VTDAPFEDGLSRRERAEVRRRNLRTVGALSALFLLPLAGAFVLYYGIGWSPGTRVNHGELIEPARPLPAVSLPSAATHRPVASVFTKRWALVYVGGGRCERECRFALYLMRSARLDLGHDMSRVERVFLDTDGCCGESLARQYPGMIVLDASGGSAAKLREAFPRTDRGASLFVVDPLGNLMMRYDSRRDPMGLVEDLQRLLRLSQIG